MFDTASLRAEIAKTDELLKRAEKRLYWVASMRRHPPNDGRVIEGTCQRIEPARLMVIQ